MFVLKRNLIAQKNIIRCYCGVQNSKNHFDIIIAGGGMVGTTLACTLGKNNQLKNKRVLLLEGNKQFKWKLTPEYSNRVSALSHGTKALMEGIGVWKNISETRCCPVKKMQVWDALSDAMITFNKGDLSETIAYIVENDVLLNAVTAVTGNTNNVTVLHEAKIKDYKLPQKHENIVEIFMENGEKYTCNLLLGCDGANSKVRKAMDVQYISWDYKQMGVVATLKLSEKTENIVAWQRFLPSGPIAILPLNEETSSLVWTTSPEHAKTLLRLPIEKFVDEINSALWKEYPKSPLLEKALKGCNSVLETLNLPSNAVRQLPPNIADCAERSRAAFPLGFGHSTTYVAKCVALVGDAAHRVHPLAGQGVNLGFGDVDCLNTLLGQAIYSGQNLGNLANLKQYESQRQRHNVPTMLAIDGLQKLYGTELTPVVVLRTLGLQITHALNPLKNLFAEHASK